MPSSRPRVAFDETGQCNACSWLAGPYREIDWKERSREFLDLIRTKKRHPVYDCIVPFSGGKDSASIAHRLKSQYGLNPLLVCYGQLAWTDVGRRNLHAVADAGFDVRYWRTNQRVSRLLTRRFFIERGHPKNHYDSAINAIPVLQALESNIPLVIYAEHGESFYGGNVLSEEHRRTRDLAEVLENQVGDDARNWAVDGIEERDLWPYVYPPVEQIREKRIEAFYYSYFFPWDILKNAEYAREMMGFEQAHHYGESMMPWPGRNAAPSYWVEFPTAVQLRQREEMGILPWWGKSDGSFEGFDSIDDCIDDLDYYMMYVKFGFGRATRMASRLIQMGHMNREQGLSLAKRYDGEFPRRYLPQICEYLGMDEKEIRSIAELHKNPEIWDGDSLRYPLV